MKWLLIILSSLCFASQGGYSFGQNQDNQPSTQAGAAQTGATDDNTTGSTGTQNKADPYRRTFFGERFEQNKDSERKRSAFVARVFQPRARVYFDTGTDDTNELDLFQDGSISATLSLLEIGYWWDLGAIEQFAGELDGWGFGIVGGVGIGSPAVGQNDDGTDRSSAGVALINIGIALDTVLSDSPTAGVPAYGGVEFGYAHGFSADEDFDDSSDGAIYIGVSFSF